MKIIILKQLILIPLLISLFSCGHSSQQSITNKMLVNINKTVDKTIPLTNFNDRLFLSRELEELTDHDRNTYIQLPVGDRIDFFVSDSTANKFNFLELYLPDASKSYAFDVYALHNAGKFNESYEKVVSKKSKKGSGWCLVDLDQAKAGYSEYCIIARDFPLNIAEFKLVSEL